MKALIDTNILVDFAQKSEDAAKELNRYEKLLVSRITWIEFLVGARDADEVNKRHLMLDMTEVVEIDAAVSAETVTVRKFTRLKLPDAVILATARVHGLLLVTRNSRDFPRRDPHIRIPY